MAATGAAGRLGCSPRVCRAAQAGWPGWLWRPPSRGTFHPAGVRAHEAARSRGDPTQERVEDVVVGHLGGGHLAQQAELLPPELKRLRAAHRALQHVLEPLDACVRLVHPTGQLLLRGHALQVLPEGEGVDVPVRLGDLVHRPVEVRQVELRRHAQLVQVAVAAEQRHAVGVALLERDEQLAQAEVARPVIANVAAVDEVRALMHQLQLLALAVEAHDAARGLHPLLKVGEVALNVRAVRNLHRIARHPAAKSGCKSKDGRSGRRCASCAVDALPRHKCN